MSEPLPNATTTRSVFVSGGAGFIGSHLIRRLISRPSLEKLVVFDNFSSGLDSHLSDLQGDTRLQIVRADLKDKDAVAAAMRGCEVVFHLAANPDIAKAVTQPDIDFWEGTYLAQNVIEAMRVTGAKRILYTSGSGVYGENDRVAFAENYGPCVPISTYGGASSRARRSSPRTATCSESRRARSALQTSSARGRHTASATILCAG